MKNNKVSQIINVIKNGEYENMVDIANSIDTTVPYVSNIIKKYNLKDMYNERKVINKNNTKISKIINIVKNGEYKNTIDIAKQADSTQSYVSKVINDHNLKDIYKNRNTGSFINNVTKQKVIDLIKSGEYDNCSDIAKQCGLDRSSVYRIIFINDLKNIFMQNKITNNIDLKEINNKQTKIIDTIKNGKYYNSNDIALQCDTERSYIVYILQKNEDLREIYNTRRIIRQNNTKTNKIIDIIKNGKYCTMYDIAEQCNCDIGLVSRTISNNGLKYLYKQNIYTGNINKETKIINIVKNVEYYDSNDIAQMAECSSTYVYTILKKHDLMNTYKLNKKSNK